MQKNKPNFIDTPFFVGEIGNWHLTDDAPDEIKKEFKEFMKDLELPEIKKP